MRKVNVNHCKKYSSVQSRQRVEKSRSKLGRSESEYVEDDTEIDDPGNETVEAASRPATTALSLQEFSEPAVPHPTSATGVQPATGVAAGKPGLSTPSASATPTGSDKGTASASAIMPSTSVSPRISLSPPALAVTQPAATTGDDL